MEPDRSGEKSEAQKSAGRYDNTFAPLLLLILVVVLYQNSVAVPFVADDRLFVEQNKTIRNLGGIGDIWSYNPTRFFTFLSLAVNYQLGGYNVTGYHIFNILIHFLNCWILFWFARLLLLSSGREKKSFASDSLSRLFPFFVAAVFAAHPINTQAVTYIWQRNTSLATLFYLLAMALYLKFALTEKQKDRTSERSWLLLAGAFTASIVATLTKQISATLPIAILLLDYCFISGSVAGLKKRATVLAIFLPTLFVIPVLTATGGNLEISHIGQAQSILPWYDYLATQFNVIVFVYFKLLFFPVGQTLDHDFPAATSPIDAGLSIVLLLTLLFLSIFFFNKNRLAAFGFLFFTLTMSVESSFFPLEDLVFEHRMYLPLTGLFISITALLFSITPQVAGSKNAVAPLLLLLVAILSALLPLTIKRNEVWQTRESLWLDVIAKAPNKTRGYMLLGQEYLVQGRFSEAKILAEKALAFDPSSGDSYFLLGLVAAFKEDNEKAIGLFNNALAVKPKLYRAHYALGDIYKKKKSYALAVKNYKAGVYMEGKNNIGALMALAETQSYATYYTEAIATYNFLLKLTPSNRDINHNLAILYDLVGEKEKSAYHKNVARKHGVR